MSVKPIFKTIIRDGQKRFPIEGHPRIITIPLQAERIITLTGGRRTGKTYTQYQMIRTLLEKGLAQPSQIVYINLEDDRLFPLTLEKLGELPDAYYELFPDHRNKTVWFFLDEIQIVHEWERFVRRLQDTEKCHIILTGSSSALLSREIATQLRGRTLSYEIFPFSFFETISFLDIEPDIYHSDSVAKLRYAMNRYLESGGFPEVVQMLKEQSNSGEDPSGFHTIQQKIWQDYIDLILYKDIIERHQVSNTWLLKYYLKFLLMNSANLVSIQKVYRDFKSQGIKVSKNSLYEYLIYLEEAYALFTVPIYSRNLRDQQRNPRKIYPLDIGLKRAVTQESDTGRELETLVFQQLRRYYKDICYWKGKQELDFCIRDEQDLQAPLKLINVSARMDQPDTRKREIDGLKEAAEAFHVQDAIIITLDDEEKIDLPIRDGHSLSIEIIPFWKWVLLDA